MIVTGNSGSAKQKVAVFGGTFNPVHNGHIHMAMRFAEILGVQKVILIPSGLPPHKQAPDLASAGDRLAMCRLAAENGPFEVSDIEIMRSGPSYTADTLRELKKREPQTQFFFLTGEDMFLTLEKWHEPEVIFALADVCAAPRSFNGMARLQDCACRLKKLGARVHIENIQYLPVSSSMVRAAVKKGQDITGMVPEGVAGYINQNYLYRG